MKKIEMVKAVGEIIVSVGVGAIVGNIIKTTTPANVGSIKKICIGIGSVVLSSMVNEYASKYTTEKIDQAATGLKDLVTNGDLDITQEE